MPVAGGCAASALAEKQQQEKENKATLPAKAKAKILLCRSFLMFCIANSSYRFFKLPQEFYDLLNLFLALGEGFPLDGIGETVFEMDLKNIILHPADGANNGMDLGEDIHAIPAIFDHPLDPADLALDPFKGHNLALVRGI